MEDYILEHFDEALEKNWIKVYFQPIVRSLTGNVCGAEALARWIDPDRGIINPSDFIPVLEENGLIYRLDCFVLEKVCNGFQWKAERIGTGAGLIPVSVNISRLDFSLTNMVQKIENLIVANKMPRDMLNIEITESAFVSDEKVIRKAVDELHALGFKVCMDDFGSGYSSLNVLKDYDFDELKIDMEFLANFSEKSRKIIRSIVRMAKDIGVQTLAEGVETKEEYEFLKGIGCEKIQGFYFGRPDTPEEALDSCVEKGMKIETRPEGEYYDKIGRLDFMDSRSMALFEDDGKVVKNIFANEEYRLALKSNGTRTMAEAERKINHVGTGMHRHLRKFVDQVERTGEEGVTTYPSGTQYMEVKARVVAKCNGRCMLQASTANITRNLDEENKENHDDLIRNLLYLYDSVSIIDYGEGKTIAYNSAGGKSELNQSVKGLNLYELRDWFQKKVIYPDDWEEFHVFADPDTMRDRLKKNNGRISHYFRDKQEDGSYILSHHIVMAIPGTDFNKCVIVSAKSTLNDPAMMRKIINHYGDRYGYRVKEENAGSSNISPEILWKNVAETAPVKFFWKDRERRFAGVSNAFLQYFGLSSSDEIYGKTDEEMQWHMDEQINSDREEEVINKGKAVFNCPQKCIIRGRVHNIFTSKMPLYHNGNIQGLIGYFFDSEEFVEMNRRSGEAEVIDPVTGFSNITGLLVNFYQYDKARRENAVNYMMIRIVVESCRQFSRDFGNESGDRLIITIAEVIRRNFPIYASFGRRKDGDFLVFCRASDMAELEPAIEKAKNEIREIRIVNGHRLSCYPEVYTMNGNERDAAEKFVKLCIK